MKNSIISFHITYGRLIAVLTTNHAVINMVIIKFVSTLGKFRGITAEIIRKVTFSK